MTPKRPKVTAWVVWCINARRVCRLCYTRKEARARITGKAKILQHTENAYCLGPHRIIKLQGVGR